MYYAAAILKMNSVFIGKGDRTSILRMLLKSKGKLHAAKDKLILLQMGMFYNTKLYADEFKVYPDKFTFAPNIIYKLWF